MSLKSGFAGIDRTIIRHEAWKDPKTLKILLWCALNARETPKTYKNCENLDVVVRPGQFLFSEKSAPKQLGMRIKQILEQLIHLKSTEVIDIHLYGDLLVISVLISPAYEKNLNLFENDETGTDLAKYIYKYNINLNNIRSNDLQSKDIQSKDKLTEEFLYKYKNSYATPTSQKGDIAKIVEYFCRKFEEKFGRKYIIKFGRDHASVKRLLKATGSMDDVGDMIDLFFDDGDPFLMRTGYTMGVLESRAVKYQQEMATKNC